MDPVQEPYGGVPSFPDPEHVPYLLLGTTSMRGQRIDEQKNSNIEARISKQIQISNDQNTKRWSRKKIVSVIGKFGFRDCFGFRVSNFEFNQ